MPEASSLAIPSRDLVVRRHGNAYRTVALERRAQDARYRAGERGCYDRGTCLREMFDPAGQRRATLAWALAALGVCVTAAALRRLFVPAVLLALLTTFHAGARALIADHGDSQLFGWPRSALWIGASFGLAWIAWTLRAPLSDWRAMQSRPRPAAIYARWAASAAVIWWSASAVYLALALWTLWSALRR